MHHLRQVLWTARDAACTCAASVQQELVCCTSSEDVHIKLTYKRSYTHTLCLSHSLNHSLNQSLLILSHRCLFHSLSSSSICLSCFLLSLCFSLRVLTSLTCGVIRSFFFSVYNLSGLQSLVSLVESSCAASCLVEECFLERPVSAKNLQPEIPPFVFHWLLKDFQVISTYYLVQPV